MNIRLLYFSVLLILFFACGEDKESVLLLEPETIAVTHPDDILALEDTLVRPVLYQNLPALDSLPVDQAKAKFIAAVLPAILISKYRINKERELVRQLSLKEHWTPADSVFYQEINEKYGAKNMQGLLQRMETHPNSIVLAQAAVESGWGQSRFFQEGNNLFGIWSYRADEPRMQASLHRGETPVHLRAYPDISESITDYFQTLARSRHYRHFRQARSESNEVTFLLPHLKYYSERRMDYIRQLNAIIVQNDLTRYDSYKLDPQYLIAVE